MERYARPEAARRAGVTDEYLDRLIELGLVQPDKQDELTVGVLRQVMLLHALEQAGIPLEALANLIAHGGPQLNFIETAGNDTFAPLSQVSFGEVSAKHGVPLELLSAIRESIGGRPAQPDERMREDELAVVPLVTRFRSGPARLVPR